MIWDYWTSMNLLYSIIFCWFLNSTKPWIQPVTATTSLRTSTCTKSLETCPLSLSPRPGRLWNGTKTQRLNRISSRHVSRSEFMSANFTKRVWSSFHIISPFISCAKKGHSFHHSFHQKNIILGLSDVHHFLTQTSPSFHISSPPLGLASAV